jgi:hypothetical protein
MQEAILKTWVSIVLNPPDDFVKLLTTETKKQTNILPSKKDIIFFLRNIARQSTVNRIQQKTKNERKIFNEVITVSASHCDSYKDESPKCFCFGGEKHPAHEWKSLLLSLCCLVAKENLANFDQVTEGIVGPKRKYFSKKGLLFHSPHKVEGTNVYVETNLSANNIKALCDAIYKFFGYGREIELELKDKN